MDVSRKLIFEMVESSFKKFQPCLGGRRANMLERKAILNVLHSWYVLSFDCQCDSLTIMSRWENTLTSIKDFNIIVKTCKSIYLNIVNLDIRYTTFSDFKGQLTRIPYGRPLVKPIWHLLEDVFIRKSLGSLRLCLCWLKHITKAKIPNQTLESESLNKWLRCEEKLAQLSISDNRLIVYMQEFFAQVFDKTPTPLEGFHGSGAVSETKVRCPGEKFLQDGEIPLSHIRNMIFKQPGLVQSEFLTFTNKERSDSRNWTSRLTFVPKASDSMRSICMEPTALMYAEEGIRVQVEKLIRTKSLTKYNIFINDRTINQQRAREASLSNAYATIDLSSASDLVSYSLMDKLTKTIHPDWRRLLLSVRSTHALLPDGRRVKLHKYAPMGSALCFPMETLVFTAVCHATERIAAEYYNQIQIHDYVVFGDDIIFNSSLFSLLTLNLEYLGFEVNIDKSFYDGCFRESCGGDYYLGHDVTPQYNRLDISKRDKRFRGEFAMSLIGLANNALLAGYKHLRYYYIRLLNEYYKETHQHVHFGITNDLNDTSKLLTFSQVYTEKRRYNKKLQCVERKCLVPHAHYHGEFPVDRYILTEYLRDMAYTDRDRWGVHPHSFGLMDRIGRASISYAPKWVEIDPKEEIW